MKSLETAADYLIALNAIAQFKAITIQAAEDGVLISIYPYDSGEEYASPEEEIEGEDLYEAARRAALGTAGNHGRPESD